jgi:hypothetical protein
MTWALLGFHQKNTMTAGLIAKGYEFDGFSAFQIETAWWFDGRVSGRLIALCQPLQKAGG